MINLSMTQALDLWTELMGCFYGVNRGYGEDIAEIYAFRVLGSDPMKKLSEEEERRVAASLSNLLRHFCAGMDCAAVVDTSGTCIPGQVKFYPQPGKGGSIPPFCHRVHIQILKKST